MSPRVIRRCTDCGGSGYSEQVVGEDRSGMGGGSLRTRERDCPDCEGEGTVIDGQYEEWAEALASLPAKCSCGWRGQGEDFWRCEDMNGFMTNCPKCKSSLLITMAAAEAQMEKMESVA